MTSRKFTVHSTVHTSFTVPDLDRVVAFFTEGLGFSARVANASQQLMEDITGVRGAAVRCVVVQCPGHALELFEYVAPAERPVYSPRPCDVGAAHVAFMVDDVDAAVAVAADYGFHPAGEICSVTPAPDLNLRLVYVRDQPGLTIEFLQKL
jgi:catechol 2,3-dioxygenase-like lactoylglutathione lyase family enzyme